jgi:hypothetical protein
MGTRSLAISSQAIAVAVIGRYCCRCAPPRIIPLALHRTLDIPQTFGVSFDEGKRSSGHGDPENICFEAVDPTSRYLTPKGKALMAVMGTTSVGYAGCTSARYSDHKIGIDTVPQGTYFCAKSNQGRIAEFSYHDLLRRTRANPRILTLTITYTAWEQ